MPTARKAALIDELAEKLGRINAAALVDYRGLTVAEISGLRGQLRQREVELQVTKNTLLREAALRNNLTGLEDLFAGPTAVAFIYGDEATGTKALNEFFRTARVGEIKSGILRGGRRLSAEQFARLADLPNRQTLLAQIAGLLQSPLAQLATLFNAPAQQLAYALAALEEKGGAAGAGIAPSESHPTAGAIDSTAEAPVAEAPPADAEVALPPAPQAETAALPAVEGEAAVPWVGEAAAATEPPVEAAAPAPSVSEEEASPAVESVPAPADAATSPVAAAPVETVAATPSVQEEAAPVEAVAATPSAQEEAAPTMGEVEPVAAGTAPLVSPLEGSLGEPPVVADVATGTGTPEEIGMAGGTETEVAVGDVSVAPTSTAGVPTTPATTGPAGAAPVVPAADMSATAPAGEDVAADVSSAPESEGGAGIEAAAAATTAPAAADTADTTVTEGVTVRIAPSEPTRITMPESAQEAAQDVSAAPESAGSADAHP